MADSISSTGLFESWDGLNKLVDFLIKARQPIEQTFYFTNPEMERVDNFLKNLGSSGVTAVPLKGTAIGCSRIIYGGFCFNLVNIDKAELIMEETKVEKGDMLIFHYQSEKESIDKTFFIKEVGIKEFIGVELGTSNKTHFRFLKKLTK